MARALLTSYYVKKSTCISSVTIGKIGRMLLLPLETSVPNTAFRIRPSAIFWGVGVEVGVGKGSENV